MLVLSVVGMSEILTSAVMALTVQQNKEQTFSNIHFKSTFTSLSGGVYTAGKKL